MSKIRDDSGWTGVCAPPKQSIALLFVHWPLTHVPPHPNCSFRHLQKLLSLLQVIRNSKREREGAIAKTITAEKFSIVSTLFVSTPVCRRLFSAASSRKHHRLLLLPNIIAKLQSFFSLASHQFRLRTQFFTPNDSIFLLFTRRHRYANTYLLNVEERMFMAVFWLARLIETGTGTPTDAKRLVVLRFYSSFWCYKWMDERESEIHTKWIQLNLKSSLKVTFWVLTSVLTLVWMFLSPKNTCLTADFVFVDRKEKKSPKSLPIFGDQFNMPRFRMRLSWILIWIKNGFPV